MKFIEIDLNIRLKESIKLYDLPEKLSQGINAFFKYNSKTMKFHEENNFKLYSYSLLEPLEKDKIYKKNKVYSFKIRFMNKNILNDFYKSLSVTENSIFSVINKSFIAIIMDKPIDYIETVTPCIITIPHSKPIRHLDRKNYDKDFVINQITHNACKKYALYNEIDFLNHNFIEDLDILNINPLIFGYKEKVMIGNKFRIKIKDDLLSQQIAFLSLSSGLAEKNSLSYGFSKAIYRKE